MEPDLISNVLSIIADRHGIDFRDYRAETVSRGVTHRMNALHLTSLEGYMLRLVSDEHEISELTRSLLVPVTEFFRDPEVFQALATEVLPSFLWRRSSSHVLRVWSIGVATGEEAWSLAMLLDQGRQVYGYSDFHMVASDLDEGSLATARCGSYPYSATANIPEPMRSQFFIRRGGMAIVEPQLRSRVHFVQHDIVGRTLAPPRAVVASFDIVLIRNVLIYFDRRLQAKALERVCSVVEADGALVLGLVETLPNAVAGLFETFPGTHPAKRIFRRRR